MIVGEDKIWLTHESDTREEEDASDDLGDVETILENDGGETDGDDRTGVYDAESIRNWNV